MGRNWCACPGRVVQDTAFQFFDWIPVCKGPFGLLWMPHCITHEGLSIPRPVVLSLLVMAPVLPSVWALGSHCWVRGYILELNIVVKVRAALNGEREIGVALVIDTRENKYQVFLWRWLFPWTKSCTSWKCQNLGVWGQKCWASMDYCFYRLPVHSYSIFRG